LVWLGKLDVQQQGGRRREVNDMEQSKKYSTPRQLFGETNMCFGLRFGWVVDRSWNKYDSEEEEEKENKDIEDDSFGLKKSTGDKEDNENNKMISEQIIA
jgi:hypothetical protein